MTTSAGIIADAVAQSGDVGVEYTTLLRIGLSAGLNPDQTLLAAEGLVNSSPSKILRVFMDENRELTEEEVTNLIRHLRDREPNPSFNCRVVYRANNFKLPGNHHD